MRVFLFLFCIPFLFGCNKEKNIEIKEKIIEIKENCFITYKPSSIKWINDKGKSLYYTVLYGDWGGEVYDTLKLIVSDIDISAHVKVDRTLDYRKIDSEKLVRCLQNNNKNSYVQDLWLDMKELLDPEDDANWTDYDKDGNRQLVKGIYPEVITIEYPIGDTFKIDSEGAEIKSHLYSPHADTLETLIEWSFENGKYVFKKYTTIAIDDYDPAVD